MRKMIVLALVFVCTLGMAGCSGKVDFDDFAEYEADLNAVAQFVADYDFGENEVSTLRLDTSGYIRMGDAQISDDSLIAAVKRIREKGFTYIEVDEDYLIFWENETGYYGVLWADDPVEEIARITKEARPYMKSRKLADEWYEVGALDSI